MMIFLAGSSSVARNFSKEEFSDFFEKMYENGIFRFFFLKTLEN